MYEGSPYDFGTDFSGLAESPPPPPEKPKTPEFFDDDDDEDADAEPKTIRDYFEKQDEERDKKEAAPEEAEEEVVDEAEDEPEEEAGSEDEEDSENPETENDAKEMTDEEEQEAAVKIIEERQEEAREPNEQVSSETDIEDAAAEDFLETAKQEIENGQGVDEALEAAKAKTLEEIGVEQEPLEQSPEQSSVEEEPAEPESPRAESVELPPVVEAEAPQEDIIPPVVPASAVPPGGPIPPIPPGGGMPGAPMPAGPDVLAPAPTAASPETTENTIEDRRHIGHPLLVGGIIGYMIGRRSGRIKTEKELLPIQHKLEKEVTALQEKIFWHEASVRTLAHAKAVENPAEAKKALERLKEQNRETSPESNDERVVEQKTDAAQTERLGLGKLAVEAEKPSRPEVFRPENLKPVEAMTLQELLVVAASIKVEQSTLRHFYESNRLNDEGLRRIIRAYLRGERYDELLRENMLSPEKYAYSETLTHNGVTPDMVNTFNQQQGANPFQATPPGSSVNPAQSSSPSQTPDYWGYPVAKSKQNYSAIVVAGIIIAVLIVAFLFIR